MNVIVRQDMGPGAEGIVVSIPWPPGWSLPRVDEHLDLHAYGVSGRVYEVTWEASIPDGYPHMVEWSVVLGIR